jgi:hypothetical protein
MNVKKKAASFNGRSCVINETVTVAARSRSPSHPCALIVPLRRGFEKATSESGRYSRRILRAIWIAATLGRDGQGIDVHPDPPGGLVAV